MTPWMTHDAFYIPLPLIPDVFGLWAVYMWARFGTWADLIGPGAILVFVLLFVWADIERDHAIGKEYEQ